MQYSPKLKNAMKELKKILLKYDIAGTITIHTPGHAEYLNHITPSYSCAKIVEPEGRFELKVKKEHFSHEAERQNKLRDTANMLNLLSDVTGRNVLCLIEASEVTDKHLNAEYFGGGHSTETTQNN
jgi:hypothetical protein